MNTLRKTTFLVATALTILSLAKLTPAASGEMGRGKPEFGVYGQQFGNYVKVWSLREATLNFPVGCNSLILSVSTMGLESYKIAVAILITAKATNSAVRFYAHAERDDGCGVDYVQML
jgi:hypothetical protein